MQASEGEEWGSVVADELRQVCGGALTNADARVSLDGCSGTITIEFATSSEEVAFECSGFHLFRMVKCPTDTSELWVGQTEVRAYSATADIRRLMSSNGWVHPEERLPEQLFVVETAGGVEIQILCTQFRWRRRSLRG